MKRTLVVSVSEMNAQVQVIKSALNEMHHSFVSAITCLTEACDGNEWKGKAQKEYEEKIKELKQEGLVSLDKLDNYVDALCTSIQEYKHAEAQNKNTVKSLDDIIIS